MSIYVKDPDGVAVACMIWMHGLGADATDMAGLAGELELNNIPVRHVFLDAPLRPVTLNGGMPMPAWYDITGFELHDRIDKEGIAQSQKTITEVITKERQQGFEPHQIFLAGFSQGGAMAIHAGLHVRDQLAGIVALSAYLPLGAETPVELDKDTPMFLALGQQDPLVRPEWTRRSADWLRQQGFAKLSVHEYPMEHSVCREELDDLSQWLITQLEETAS